MWTYGGSVAKPVSSQLRRYAITSDEHARVSVRACTPFGSDQMHGNHFNTIGALIYEFFVLMALKVLPFTSNNATIRAILERWWHGVSCTCGQTVEMQPNILNTLYYSNSILHGTPVKYKLVMNLFSTQFTYVLYL